MNRTILIVICDFLLVSLLAFSSVDINKVADEGQARVVKTEIVTNQVDSGKDLAVVMRQALDEERKNRDLLMGELTKTRDTSSRQQSLLTEREKQMQEYQQQLAARQAQLETFQVELAAREKQAQNLQQELANREKQVLTFKEELSAREQEARRLQQEQAALQQQYAAAQTNLAHLNQELRTTSTQALVSREKLAALEAELKKQAGEAATMQGRLTELAKSNQVILTERQQLSTQLRVAEVEKKNATEQVVKMEQTIKVEREEKAKLAEGVKVLATNSTQIVQELRENRPLAPNTIFSDFAANRVQARFSAFRTGALGFDSTKRKETETILVSDGTNIFAICHVQDTPLTFWNPGTDWEALAGTLGRITSVVPIRTMLFHLQDPRLVMVPVTQGDVKALGSKVYRTAADPFKFQEAILVGAREGYYGECKFQIDLTAPTYLKLDNNFMKGLFGKFNPSRGDLVFSRTGELLGIMMNSTYCLTLKNFEPTAALQFGQDVRAQRTGDTLARLFSNVFSLPYRLQ